MKNYNIAFSYEDCTGEKRHFSVNNIAAENRQRAFDKAIEIFNQSIVLTHAIEDGKLYYKE